MIYVAAGAHVAHHRCTSAAGSPRTPHAVTASRSGQGLALMALDLTYARRLA